MARDPKLRGCHDAMGTLSLPQRKRYVIEQIWYLDIDLPLANNCTATFSFESPVALLFETRLSRRVSQLKNGRA